MDEQEHPLSNNTKIIISTHLIEIVRSIPLEEDFYEIRMPLTNEEWHYLKQIALDEEKEQSDDERSTH